MKKKRTTYRDTETHVEGTDHGTPTGKMYPRETEFEAVLARIFMAPLTVRPANFGPPKKRPPKERTHE
jgi:hypothetical protein